MADKCGQKCFSPRLSVLRFLRRAGRPDSTAGRMPAATSVNDLIPIPPLRLGVIWPIPLLTKMKPLDFSHELNRLMDPYWRKARIAARLLIKREEGRPWSPRDRRLAERFVKDSGVTNRLVQQAVNWHKAPHSYHDKLVDSKN